MLTVVEAVVAVVYSQISFAIILCRYDVLQFYAMYIYI